MALNQKELAERLGISSAAVSLYLNDHNTRRVGKKTKEQIDRALMELDYQPNLFARSLASGNSHIIGIIIPTLRPLFMDAYMNVILSAIQYRLSEKRFSILFFPTQGKKSSEVARFQLFQSFGCDGYILFGSRFCYNEDIRENIRALRETGKPFVTLNIPEVDDDSCQIIQPELIGVSGVRYLLDAGHRRILLMMGPKEGIFVQEMLANYRNLLSEYCLPYVEHDVLYGDYDSVAAGKAFFERANNHVDFTAVCCMSDFMAVGVYEVLRKLKLDIPGDISMVGRNNSIYASVLSPGLDSIDLGMAEMGGEAVQLLDTAMQGSIVPKKRHINSRIITRDSVKVIPKGG